MAERRRCAIYTRKSTEEGLEQAFNSLDAQREACAAYIMSQAHEGWEAVRGPIPIGYRLADRKLLVNDEEAATVRLIFERYVALKSLRDLADELSSRGLKTKRRSLKSGAFVGGVSFGRGPLATMLQNPIYLGKVHHNGELFDGQHRAIIEEDLWQQAQQVRVENGSDRKLGSKLLAPSLLTGMITDPDGNPMTPSHCVRRNRRYRYYETRQRAGQARTTPWRVPAGELDRVVAGELSMLLQRREQDRLVSGEHSREQFEAARDDAKRLPTLAVPEQRAIAISLALIVRLSETSVSLAFGEGSAIESNLPARLARHGHELRIAIAPDRDQQRRHPDRVLLRLVAHASAANKMMLSGEPEPSVSHYGKRHLWQLLRISWLAPDILGAIVDGKQPPELTGRVLLRATNIPLDWPSQRALFGFA